MCPHSAYSGHIRAPLAWITEGRSQDSCIRVQAPAEDSQAVRPIWHNGQTMSWQHKREWIISESVSKRLLTLKFDTSRLVGFASSISAKWEKWPRGRWETWVQPERSECFKTRRVYCFCHRRRSILHTRSTTAALNSQRSAAFISTTRWPPFSKSWSSEDLHLEQFFSLYCSMKLATCNMCEECVRTNRPASH